MPSIRQRMGHFKQPLEWMWWAGLCFVSTCSVSGDLAIVCRHSRRTWRAEMALALPLRERACGMRAALLSVFCGAVTLWGAGHQDGTIRSGVGGIVRTMRMFL